MVTALFLLLFTSNYSTARTSWMTPDAFHLALGMKRDAVMKRLKDDGWKPEKGKEDDVVLLYDEKRTLTLGFQSERLHSLRFELVDFIPDVKAAFSEREKYLTDHYGEPSRHGSDTTLLNYDHALPNIQLVLSTDRSSSFGVQGLGFVVVRYFNPAAK